MPSENPSIEESKFIRTVVEFRSGTPPMTFWSTQLTITSDSVVMEYEVDGKVQRGSKLRRSSITKMTVDFDASRDDE